MSAIESLLNALEDSSSMESCTSEPTDSLFNLDYTRPAIPGNMLHGLKRSTIKR